MLALMSIPLEETQSLLEQPARVLDDSEPASIEQLSTVEIAVSEEDKAEMEAMLLRDVQLWTEKYNAICNTGNKS